MVAHGLLQLAQAAHPQRGVTRPVGLVEGAPRGLDRLAQVGGVGVGGHPEHFLGRGVHGVEGAGRAGDQLAVDEQSALAVSQ